MHVCLLIDLLTLFALIRGLFYAGTPARKLLCLACLIYLLAVGLHYYLVFAPWFGFFTGHRSMAAIGISALLDFFGGFWTFFGVMVFAKGVSYIALIFALYNGFGWLNRAASRPPQNALLLRPDPPQE